MVGEALTNSRGFSGQQDIVYSHHNASFLASRQCHMLRYNWSEVRLPTLWHHPAAFLLPLDLSIPLS